MKANPLDQLSGICEQLLFRVANLHNIQKSNELLYFYILIKILYLFNKQMIFNMI